MMGGFRQQPAAASLLKNLPGLKRTMRRVKKKKKKCVEAASSQILFRVPQLSFPLDVFRVPKQNRWEICPTEEQNRQSYYPSK